MSETKLDAAMSTLQKPQDGATLLRALISIRKEVEWPRNRDNIARLRDKGCLKQLSGVLQNSTHRNSIDVALSILGNCLMDRGCTGEVVTKYNIMSVINQLLKRYPKEDSVNGRVFRIIGNMCQHRDKWANIIIDRKPHIVIHIVDVVRKASKDEFPENEKISDATIIMALKSLRELLNSQTVMQLVKGFGVLKAVGGLFIKYSIEWEKSKGNEKLLLDIIRLLQEYSRYKYYQSILMMRNTERGDSLVHLSNILVLAPRRIVKIVMNFIRISQLKSELPIPEICDKFIQVLENHCVVKEFGNDCIEYLHCLCYLLDHPANRNTDRCGKSIPLLIKVLKEFEEPSNTVLECCVMLIASLNKFKYNPQLLRQQLSCNIIQVLLEKLYWLVGSSNKLSLRHSSERKRRYLYSPSKGSCDKKHRIQEDSLIEVPLSPCSSDDELDFFSFSKLDRSPSPCSSSDSESLNALSWSSPCSSPNSILINKDNSDSDDYSPVCSEADELDFPLDNEEDVGLPVLFHHEPIEPEDDLEYEQHAGEEITVGLKVGLLMEITNLLKTYIKLKPQVPHLANENLFLTLVKCSIQLEGSSFQHIDTVDLICQILEYQGYLLPLMQTNFVQTLYDLTLAQHSHWCAKCTQYLRVGQAILRKFNSLAESGMGKGDIAHKLLRGDMDTKRKLVLAVPYIVKNKVVLGKLMLNCGGLDILMKLLQENGDLNKRSIKVLCAMASRNLAIVNPKQPSKLDRPKIVADKYKLPEGCLNIVTFILEDGNTVKADREFLIKKSEFFNGLLNGHFKESNESEVKLPNVEYKSLRCLLHLLTTVEKSETIEIDLDLETLLDIILLCDRYLLVDLCVILTDTVEQFKISTKTVHLIYDWSLQSGTNLLRVESVAFALVANVEDSERYVMFENLFNLGYPEQLLEDIQNLLVRYLTMRDHKEREDLSKKRLKDERMRDRLLKSNC